ncbi:MAG: hypothetical protein PHC35_00150 [Deltaproteobacteria bacterium]|nr:hypothetical protein [Deltaproteobacteria bacterium]
MMPNKKLMTAFMIATIMLIGLFVRLDGLMEWNKQPDRAFFQGQPLSTTFDAPYYLALARDLAHGEYERFSQMRAVPANPLPPTPPPLLSVMAAALTKLGMNLNWVGALLTPFLALLLALPMYGIGSLLLSRTSGLAAAIVGLLAFPFVARSSIGWFDTDSLNLVFVWSLCFLAIYILKRDGMRRYLAWGCYVILGLLFVWWWDQARKVAAVLAILPAVMTFPVFLWRLRKEKTFYAALTGMAVLTGILAYLAVHWGLVAEALQKYGYISKQGGLLPNIGVSISEQQTQDLMTTLASATGETLAPFLAILGYLAWLIRKRDLSALLVLTVPVGLACLSLFAYRFLIFAGPAIGLGIGMCCFELLKLSEKRPVLRYAAIALPLLICVKPVYLANKQVIWPSEQPYILEGMVEAKKVTPADAIIWTWWDHGHNLIYWADRAAVSDGQFHGGFRTVANAIPYTANDARLAANFMQFFVTRGEDGFNTIIQAIQTKEDEARRMAEAISFLKRVLAAGPDEAREIIKEQGLKSVADMNSIDKWLAFFFPSVSRPLYFFTDKRTSHVLSWIFYFATWNPVTKTGGTAIYEPFTGLSESSSGFLTSQDGHTKVDLTAGSIDSGQNHGMLLFSHECGKEKRFYGRPIGHVFLYNSEDGTGAIMSDNLADSVFNRLFVCKEGMEPYFKPILTGNTAYQLWEVRGDRIPNAKE